MTGDDGQRPGPAPAGVERWADVDRYVAGLLLGDDPLLDAAARRAAEHGLPAHGVSRTQGRLLEVLVRIRGARLVLEIGTLAGESTIWLARGLASGGRIVTLEIDPDRAAVARANLAAAGVADAVDVRVGPALDALAALAREGGPPFDLVFVDADKQRTADYVEAALCLAAPGSVIVLDNVVRGGALADEAAAAADDRVRGVRRAHEVLAADTRIVATTIQTVGEKGYDGFTLAVVAA